MKATDRHFVDEVVCVLEGANELMRVANLSVGGLFAATKNPPELGTLVTVELRLPKRDCWLVGRVSWINEPTKPINASLPEGFGLMFTRVPADDQAAIRDVLRWSQVMLSAGRISAGRSGAESSG
jgi:Tfp pilus assembly protein PilZ